MATASIVRMAVTATNPMRLPAKLHATALSAHKIAVAKAARLLDCTMVILGRYCSEGRHKTEGCRLWEKQRPTCRVPLPRFVRQCSSGHALPQTARQWFPAIRLLGKAFDYGVLTA